MGIAEKFDPEKLMCGILYSENNLLEKTLGLLEKEFGPVDYQSSPAPFHFSHYYDDEIGGPIKRVFVSFAALIDPSRLASVKIKTNALEQLFADGKKRPVNLDPGLISTGRLLLATTKRASHRIALSDGIYVEMTLFFSRKAFQSLPWTYPDFSSDEVKTQMKEIRALLKEQQKKEKERMPHHED